MTFITEDFLLQGSAARRLYHLSGEARHLWEHSIAAMDVRRWSVTFRSLSAKGLRAIGDTGRS